MIAARCRSFARISAALTGLLALSLTGCGLGDSAPSVGDSLSQPAVVYGTNFGGNTPIVGAKIGLYSSGTGGYGNAAAVTGYDATSAPHLLTYTISADNTSNFSFNKVTSGGTNDGGLNSSWSCPTTSDPLIYLIATGGDPQGGTYNSSLNNPVIVNAAVIGYCSTISSSTRVNLNEISTVGFAVSFAPFMYPGTSTPGNEAISSSAANPLTGAKPQGAIGMYNAFQNLTANLIDIPNGGVIATPQARTGSASSVSTTTVTATPESAKIISMANILSACINSNNTSTVAASENTYCQQLFDGAQKPYVAAATSYGDGNSNTFPAPVDTLQAALYMQLNPAGLGTAGTNAVSGGGYCNGAGATTNIGCLYGMVSKNTAFSGGLGSQPTDWTVGITYTANTGTCPNGGSFFDAPYKSAVDASGNLYFVTGTATHANLAELSPIGQPLACLGDSTTVSGRGITIDPTGNVWAAFNTTTTDGIKEYPSTGGSLIAWATPTIPYNVISNGEGDVLAITNDSGGSIYEWTIPGTNTTPVTATLQQTGLYGSGAQLFGYAALDSSQNFWASTQQNPKELAHAPIGGGTVYNVAALGYTQASGGVYDLSVTHPGTGTVLKLAGFQSSLATTYGINGTVITTTGYGTTTGTCLSTYTQCFKAPIGSYSSTNTTTSVTESMATATVVNTYKTAASDDVQATTGYGLAADSGGNVYTGTNAGTTAATNNLLEKWSIGSSTSTQSTTYLGGINGTRSIAVDGASNLWVGLAFSQVGNASATTNFGVAEIATKGSSTFTALSPAPTVTTPVASCSNSVGCPTGGSFYKTAMQEARDISIDPSGNVWVMVTGNETGSSQTEVLAGAAIEEIVGVAVPTATPLSSAVAAGKLAKQP